MASKRKTIKRAAAARPSRELDNVFMLKLALYLIVGSQWLRFVHGDDGSQIPLPVGLVIGVLFAYHDHFQIDRKIEYAVLLVATFVGFWVQVGVYVNL